jgi:PAS domain S-box-containing protein
MVEQELNRYWKTVVDTIQDGILIVDQDGTIVSVNKAFRDMTGYSASEIIGKPCSILDCTVCAIAREKKGDKWCALFRKGRVSMRRCALRKKDGGFIQVLKNASLLRNAEGEVLGAVETLTDLTEIVEKDNQIEAFRRELRREDHFHGLVGMSLSMQHVFDLIRNAAPSDAPVILFGESGTGKELAAKAIHDLGQRKRKPFVKVNCASLSESLLESELFGHVKGAFTGAYKNREGRFEAAQGGDIFLDEIGDLPGSTQVKLLRVLEEKVVERVGDNLPLPVDVRIISATNRNLKQLVDAGTFRHDLFFRINVIPIILPPLRDRAEDIPLLSESFLERMKLKTGKNIQGVSAEAMEFLMVYAWPGNVRELRSAFEYAFVTCQEAFIQPHHLPPGIASLKKVEPSEPRAGVGRKEKKKQELIEALRRSGGNQSEAARMLGVSRVTVWNRIRQFGLSAKGSGDL